MDGCGPEETPYAQERKLQSGSNSWRVVGTVLWECNGSTIDAYLYANVLREQLSPNEVLPAVRGIISKAIYNGNWSKLRSSYQLLLCIESKL